MAVGICDHRFTVTCMRAGFVHIGVVVRSVSLVEVFDKAVVGVNNKTSDGRVSCGSRICNLLVQTVLMKAEVSRGVRQH